MALGPDGRLYFADGLSGIRVVDGEYVRTTAPSVGGGHGLAFAADGRLFAATGGAISEVKGAKAELVAGSPTEGGEGYHIDGPALAARFEEIQDIAFDSQGRLLIVDRRWIRVLEAGQVTTLAGTGVYASAPTDGPALAADLVWPRAILEGEAGIYFSDATYLRLLHGGLVTTLAGVKKSVYAVDGPLDQSRFTGIGAMAWKQDVMYLVDWRFARRIRYIKDSVVYSLTDGQMGFRDGPISEALFDGPGDLVVDAKGNLIVGDPGNCRIRYIQLEP